MKPGVTTRAVGVDDAPRAARAMRPMLAMRPSCDRDVGA